MITMYYYLSHFFFYVHVFATYLMQRNEFIITAPVCIERGPYDLIHVRYNNTFLEDCTVHSSPYDVSSYQVVTTELPNRAMRKSVTAMCLLISLSFSHSQPVLKCTCIHEISENYATVCSTRKGTRFLRKFQRVLFLSFMS